MVGEDGMERLRGWETGLLGCDEGLLLIHTTFRIAVVQKRSYAQIPIKVMP